MSLKWLFHYCTMTIIICTAVPLYPTFSAIPGELLWSLMDQVGQAVNAPLSQIEILSSLNDIAVSKVDLIGSFSDEIQSDVDAFESRLESLTEFLCSQIEVIQSDIAIWASKLDAVDSGILSVSDVLTLAISESEVLLFSLRDVIITAIDESASVLDSTLDAFATCLNGVLLTQANFTAGTLFITEPGTYTLCEDITFSGSVAVSIQSNNVVFDLNGHTIATDNNDVINIISSTGVAVKNGTLISSAMNTLFIISSTDVSINAITGISTMINILDSSDITVTGFVNRGNNVGLSATQVDGLTVRDSVVYDAASFGFYVTESNFVFESCQALNAATVGMFFQSNDAGVVRDCYASGSDDGFVAELVASSSAILFEHVIAENCFRGFGSFASSNVLVMESSFTSCNEGIEIDSSTDMVIKRCSVVNNAIGIMINSPSINTQILDSCVINNGTNIIDGGTNTMVMDLVTFFEILSSKLDALDDSIISGLDGASSILDSFLDIAFSDLDALIGTAQCLVQVAITQDDLPYTITAAGSYVVCEPLLHNGSPVITINADNVELNLNQYTVTTDNQAITSTGHTNITIRNGAIRPGQQAIAVSNATYIALNDLEIYEPADVAIQCTTVQNVQITGTIVHGNNGFVTGITMPGAFYLDTCYDAAVSDCHVFSTSNTPVRGFVCVSTPSGGMVNIAESTVHTVQQDGFLAVESGVSDSSGVLFSGCRAVQATNGFSTTNSIVDLGPSFIQCVALNCTQGFVIQAATGCLLQECIAMQNSSNGFSCDVTSSALEFISCISNFNLIGFNLPGSNNTCSLCTAIGNAFQGILLSATSGDTVIHGMLLGRNRSAGLVDGGASMPTIVDVRSQDPANTVTPNPAYILNGALDSKGSSVVIRTS